MKAIVKYIKKIAPVLGAIEFHSFSQLVLYLYSELAYLLMHCMQALSMLCVCGSGGSGVVVCV